MEQQPPKEVTENKHALNQERNELLLRLQSLLEGPMVILGFI
jgi:hypothetical protein